MYSSVIGGPHKTFSIASYFGGTSHFFVHLSEQLSNYRNFGPPKLPSVLMTHEDIEFAKAHNEWGIEKHTDTLNECEVFEDEVSANENVSTENVEDLHDRNQT